MDDTLRKEVRFLTTRLGAIVREHAGERVFSAIEELRALSKQDRQSAQGALSSAISRRVSRLNVAEAASVAHAFSLFFHLVNLCEERQRVRRLREYEQQPAGAPISLRHTFGELRRLRVPAARVKRVLESVHVEPVLTAHPTEAKRRSVMNHILRIGRTLDAQNGAVGPAAVREIDPWIEALWLTDEVRHAAVTPAVEMENTLVYLERTIYALAGDFWDHFRGELARFDPRIKPPPPFVTFGSWVGADRDGNPNVTPETSLQASELLRQSILRYYLEYTRRMLGLLSLPAPPGRTGKRLLSEVEADMRRFPATRGFEQVDQPNEAYRRKVRIMIWRLERTMEARPAQQRDGAYASSAEFAADARLVEQLLEVHPSPRLARVGPGRLRVAAESFGFHGAGLDFRQHSSLTRAAAAELIERGGLPSSPARERIASIQKLLRTGIKSKRARLSEETARVIAEFKALLQIQQQSGEAAAHRYILSMTTDTADLWDLLLLGRAAGLIRPGPGARLASSFDVIPLFETYDDLHACGGIVEQLIADPLYRELLRSRGNFQEVMLGYSDSVKDSGYVAANWALFRAQEVLAEVAKRQGVRLGLFHGKGGTIDRGGGLSYRMVQAQPYAAPSGSLRITEQGEVISLKYANADIARRNLEQLVTSVLDAHLIERERSYSPAQLTEWQMHAEQMADSSRRFYRDLVYETPEFPDYFRQATPIDLIERLRLGSRPSRRFGAGDLRALRAIPWVFAWTQSRHFLPSWYGLGHALEGFAERAGGLDMLREMYRAWPFFSVLIDNAEASLAKTDLAIARRYAALVQPPTLSRTIFGRVEEEYDRACRWVLATSGISHLLERQPVLAESIRLRNPYVDPLSFLQIHFLERWRRSRQQDTDLLRLLQVTVGGIAFGMKSTG